ncbi:mediator of RNA polymerase II transcription subunit 15 isoform X2 [Octopus vulgaris]|uniref:Mediator of RNA polymerase II transcription subunit 15 n=1 Tax=Octopus vulgaris TaxID=6645 RepID=A0AA36F5I8_OCTVU|nr:mediator of RNA polymerase II transcription subunit 15 isoform X2 [Octopus vulgaris]
MEFRNSVVIQIENALKQSGTKIPKSSVKMENRLHQKYKTKEEYLDHLSRIIIHASELSKKRTQAASDAVNQGISPQGIPPKSLAPGQSPQEAQQQS